MTKQRLKTLFINSWIIIFLILALPTFTFNIAGQNFNINYSDRIAARLNTSLGNFRRSSDVFYTKEVKTKLSFTNTGSTNEQKTAQLNNYLNIINKRAEIAGLYDVKIKAEIDDSDYMLAFGYPEYYSDPVKYTNWLTQSGQIAFLTADQQNPQTINLNDFDIVNTINLDYLDTIGTHIVLRFDQDKIGIIQQAFASNSQNSYFLMTIDGVPDYYVIQYDQYSNTNEELVRILPTQAVNVLNVKERNDYINITRSYFLNESFKDNFSTDGSIRIIKPLYKLGSTTELAFVFVLSSIALVILFFIKFKFKGFIKYLLAVTSFLLAYITFLKIVSGNLSISFLIGFIFVYFLINSLLYYLLENISSEDRIKKIMAMIKDISVLLFIIVAIVLKLVSELYISADFFGTILIGSIVLFVMSIINFKWIFELELNDIKLPKLKKISNENK